MNINFKLSYFLFIQVNPNNENDMIEFLFFLFLENKQGGVHDLYDVTNNQKGNILEAQVFLFHQKDFQKFPQ